MNFTDLTGFTVDNIYRPDLEDKIKQLPPNSIVRLVIDECVQDYVDAAKMIQSHGVEILLQLCDSYKDGHYNDDGSRYQMPEKEWCLRMAWIKDNFWQLSYVETANEIGPINNWSSDDYLARCKQATKKWCKVQNKQRLVTLFYSDDVLDWWQKNKFECEYVGISLYPSNKMNFMAAATNIERWIKQGDVTCLSEFGFNEWEGELPDDLKKQMMDWAAQQKPTFFWGLPGDL